jgi:hypothetical protein
MPYSVGWGTDVGPLAHKCADAREALALAEEESAAGRSDVFIVDLSSKEPITIGTLRELAEEEAEDEGSSQVNLNGVGANRH